MRLSLAILFVFLVQFCVLAQSTLFIKDLESNKVIIGANVQDAATEKVFVSDSLGAVELAVIGPGTTLSISFIGYTTVIHRLTSGQNVVYMEPDYQLLNVLTVVGYEDNDNLYDIAGSYAINSKLVMDRFNDESLVRSMNTLPGIRFEERSPSSYRISIRGNLLRAPFGIRNVKVYWNGLPYTDPTGDTPLNLMDLNNIGRVEAIKGPAGSIYGAGMGGVLNIYSATDPVKNIGADVGYSAGSFGLQRLTVNVNSGGEKHRFSVKYAKQKGNGYRDHTNSDRDVIQMTGKFYVSAKRTLTAHILFSDLFYQTPGGLTQTQYDENPRQARPGAAQKKASIDHQNFFAGLVQDYYWSETLKNTTSIYLTNGTKENPFITNYELEKLKTYGGRTSFELIKKKGAVPVRFTTGAELNYGNFHASNHGNVNGYADTLRYEDQLKSLQAFMFFQASLDLSSKWKLNLGGSLNFLDYNIDRFRDVASDTSYSVNRSFKPEFMPRLATIGKLSNQLAVHGSISVGFSPPTVDEISTSDGGINTDLEAEKGINYEVGVRGNTKNDRFFYDASLFWMQQQQTIVSRTTDQGTVVFENAGATAQLGLELLLNYIILQQPNRAITLLKLQTAYTYNDFTFKNYIKRKGNENVDYSGNALTGTAPNISVTSLDLETKPGVYLNFTFNFTDRIPLDDANTIYADSYQLMTVKVGWKMQIKPKYLLSVFVGADNLLNQKYSLGNDLNAFGGRYFNAAPTRNFFGGVKIYFN